MCFSGSVPPGLSSACQISYYFPLPEFWRPFERWNSVMISLNLFSYKRNEVSTAWLRIWSPSPQLDWEFGHHHFSHLSIEAKFMLWPNVLMLSTFRNKFIANCMEWTLQHLNVTSTSKIPPWRSPDFAPYCGPPRFQRKELWTKLLMLHHPGTEPYQLTKYQHNWPTSSWNKFCTEDFCPPCLFVLCATWYP